MILTGKQPYKRKKTAASCLNRKQPLTMTMVIKNPLFATTGRYQILIISSALVVDYVLVLKIS